LRWNPLGAGGDPAHPLLPPGDPLAAGPRVDQVPGLRDPGGRGVAPVADDVDEPRLGEEPCEHLAPGDDVGALLDDADGPLSLGAKPQQIEEEIVAGALGVGVEALVEGREGEVEPLTVDELVEPAEAAALESPPPEAP